MLKGARDLPSLDLLKGFEAAAGRARRRPERDGPGGGQGEQGVTVHRFTSQIAVTMTAIISSGCTSEVFIVRPGWCRVAGG